MRKGFLVQGTARVAHWIFPFNKCELLPSSREQRPTSKQPTQVAEGEEDVTALSNGFPETAGRRPTKRSPAFFSPPSNVSSPSWEEGGAWGNTFPIGSVETPVSNLPPEGHQSTSSSSRRNVQRASEISPQPPTTIQGRTNVPPVVTASALLSLQCRMCNASPTVGSRPTATMCGHIFCSEYVPRIPGATAVGLTPRSVGVSHNTSCRLPDVPCATVPSCYIVCSD